MLTFQKNHPNTKDYLERNRMIGYTGLTQNCHADFMRKKSSDVTTNTSQDPTNIQYLEINLG